MTNERSSRRTGWSLIATAVAVTVGAAACGGGGDDGEGGGDGGDAAELSPEAEAGRDLAADSGCAACHGRNGEGGIGPAWVGLYGGDVVLEDGSTVVADDAYLARAISDPEVERVDGYTLAMPVNDLTPDEVAQIVVYVRELGGDGSTPPAPTDS